MLGQEAFKQAKGGSQQGLEQRDGTTLSSGFQQKFQDSESNQTSSVIEMRADLQRDQRKGVPEVIFGETQAIAQIITMRFYYSLNPAFTAEFRLKALFHLAAQAPVDY